MIEEYNRKMSKESKSLHNKVAALSKELENQRERVIMLIEEKAKTENELDQVKLHKKD